MTARALEQQTYQPGPPEALAEVLSFFEAHEAARGSRPTPRYFLAGSEEGEQVELPETVYQVLLQAVQALAAGMAVTIAPHDTLLTTQRAADLLGVSRPTVVKLIDTGKLAAHTPGTRRRMIALQDVLDYQVHRREAQYAALMATAADDDDADGGGPPSAADFRRIRATVAERRRNRAAL